MSGLITWRKPGGGDEFIGAACCHSLPKSRERACCGSPRHEFVETADLPVLGAVLIQERQVRVVEFGEKFVPLDLVQRSLLGPEVNPQYAGVSVFFRGRHGRRSAPAFVDP